MIREHDLGISCTGALGPDRDLIRFVLLCTAMALAVVLPIVAAIPVVPVLVLGGKW